MFDPSKFIMILSQNPDEDISVTLGGTKTLSVNVRNENLEDRAYNLSLTLTLPDGVSYDSGTEAPTSINKNENNDTIVTWTNLKDLAPNEIDYNFSFTVKSDTTYSDGTPVPFDTTFPIANIEASIDTMPRGNFDVGNIVYYSVIEMVFLAVRFSFAITLPGKALKGAGSSIDLSDWKNTFQCTVNLQNNASSLSIINLEIILPDGVRYIGNIVASGTDAPKFINPSVKIEDDGSGNLVTKLIYNNRPLSLNSNTQIKFDCAIWNRLNENTGDIITHGTSLEFSGSMSNTDATYLIYEYASVTAMDIIITKSVNGNVTDVGRTAVFSYYYKVGEYYDIDNIVITDLLPDGLQFLESSLTPTTITPNPDNFVTELAYVIGSKQADTSETVTISVEVLAEYIYLQSTNVVAGDYFRNAISLSGFNTSLSFAVGDASNALLYIIEPTVSKSVTGLFYRDGTPKSISTPSINDLVGYRISYDASNIVAEQKEIYVDDFFPLMLDPIDNIEYTYSGTVSPISLPELISPHGVTFYYGNLPGNTTANIDFTVPVVSDGDTIADYNLAKMKGLNTPDYAYSSRDQVLVSIGSPSMGISKTVSGPNIDQIKTGETYNYNIIFGNQGAATADAFDFTMTDLISPQLTFNPDSIAVTGTASWEPINIETNPDESISLTLPVNKVAPGEYVTVTYSVTVNPIAPNVSITNTSEISAPYSQSYDPELDNYQFTDQAQSSSTTIKSSNVSITKVVTDDNFKVGSEVEYIINAVFPEGTICYNSYLRDILPDGQVYIAGTATQDYIEVTPQISGQDIIFPNIDVIDALNSSVTVRYTLTATIENANKTIGTTTSTQENTGIVTWDIDSEGSATRTRTARRTITILHPNLVLTMSGRPNNSSSQYTQSLNTCSNTGIEVRIDFTNNSQITLLSGVIYYDLPSNVTFTSIKSSSKGTALYDDINNRIVISIPNLLSGASGFVTLVITTVSGLLANTSIPSISTAISYYNDLSTTKIYGGETSNVFTLNVPTQMSYLPCISDRINDYTLYKFSPRGSTVDLRTLLTNVGCGIDSYSLFIEPAELGYELYVDTQFITTVPADTAYSASLPELANVNAGVRHCVSLVVSIPDDAPDGKLYYFYITATSLTDNSVTKTITIIDPPYIN